MLTTNQRIHLLMKNAFNMLINDYCPECKTKHDDTILI